jgi:hypothetical protein
MVQPNFGAGLEEALAQSKAGDNIKGLVIDEEDFQVAVSPSNTVICKAKVDEGEGQLVFVAPIFRTFEENGKIKSEETATSKLLALIYNTYAAKLISRELFREYTDSIICAHAPIRISDELESKLKNSRAGMDLLANAYDYNVEALSVQRYMEFIKRREGKGSGSRLKRISKLSQILKLSDLINKKGELYLQAIEPISSLDCAQEGEVYKTAFGAVNPDESLEDIKVTTVVVYAGKPELGKPRPYFDFHSQMLFIDNAKAEVSVDADTPEGVEPQVVPYTGNFRLKAYPEGGELSLETVDKDGRRQTTIITGKLAYSAKP